mmetsp:Transcript_109755/g.224273  ORF Transcript_109755/g.224273 Transcript_109755/m.224273 type:complete len:131 (+) Transcript_109755:317-709(+)
MGHRWTDGFVGMLRPHYVGSIPQPRQDFHTSSTPTQATATTTIALLSFEARLQHTGTSTATGDSNIIGERKGRLPDANLLHFRSLFAGRDNDAAKDLHRAESLAEASIRKGAGLHCMGRPALAWEQTVGL